jgi:hypothetical protein
MFFFLFCVDFPQHFNQDKKKMKNQKRKPAGRHSDIESKFRLYSFPPYFLPQRVSGEGASHFSSVSGSSSRFPLTEHIIPLNKYFEKKLFKITKYTQPVKLTTNGM